MADGPTITIDATALTALVATLKDGTRRLRTIAKQVMTEQMRVAERTAKAKLSGPVLKVRTGQLRRSIGFAIDEDESGVSARFGVLKTPGGAALVYAAPHEYGATIVPKRAKVLAVPLKAALTPAGVPRFTPLEARARYPLGTFWKRARSGSLILFGKRARGLVPLFLGLTRVVLPERRYLRDTIDERLPVIRDEIQAAVLAAVLQERGAARV